MRCGLNNRIRQDGSPVSVNRFIQQGLSHSFNLKLEQLSSKNVLKYALLGNWFSELSTQVEIWY